MRSKSNASYIAAGISEDDSMGDDFVIECVKGSESVDVFTSLTSVEKTQSKRIFEPSGLVKTLSTSLTDNRIYCRVACTSAFIFQHLKINLTSERYHLMVATGKLVNRNSIGHHEDRAVSKHKIDLNKGGSVSVKSKFWIQIHGTLMMFAWMGLMFVGMLLPRFYRKDWKGKTLFNKDLWFSVS